MSSICLVLVLIGVSDCTFFFLVKMNYDSGRNIGYFLFLVNSQIDYE